MKEKDVVINQDKMYRLFEDEYGHLYIGVVCGGVAVYEMKIKLTTDEVDRYNAHGIAVMDDLANDIAHNSSSFESRAI